MQLLLDNGALPTDAMLSWARSSLCWESGRSVCERTFISTLQTGKSDIALWGAGPCIQGVFSFEKGLIGIRSSFSGLLRGLRGQSMAFACDLPPLSQVSLSAWTKTAQESNRWQAVSESWQAKGRCVFTTEPTQASGVLCPSQHQWFSRHSKWRRLMIFVFVYVCCVHHKNTWTLCSGVFRAEKEQSLGCWADLGDGRVEDVAHVTRRGFVPLSQGQCVRIQPPLDSLGLGPGQGGQQHSFVYILAVLADEVWQSGVSQPLLLLLALWHTNGPQVRTMNDANNNTNNTICNPVDELSEPARSDV